MSTSRAGLLAVVLLCACSEAREDLALTAARDSLGIRITETNVSLLDDPRTSVRLTQELFRIGSPDDRPGAEPLFAVGTALFLSDTSLVLTQGRSEILLYGPQGAPMGRSGGRGEGPGEFAYATDLREVSGGGFEVWDAGLGRASVFSAAGAFLNSRQANLDAASRAFPSIFSMLPDFRWRLIGSDRLLVFSYLPLESVPESGRFRPPLQYLAATLDVAAVDTLGTYAGIEQMRLPPELGSAVVVSLDADDSHFAVAEGSGHLYIGDGGEDHIDRYDRNGRLDMRVRLIDVDRSPQPSARAGAVQQLVEALERRGMESPNVAYLAADDPVPAFRGLNVASDGSLWVRRASPEPDTYAVFDSAGLFRETVHLPPHDRILAVAADRLAVLERSELDIESVAVYALAAGEPPAR